MVYLLNEALWFPSPYNGESNGLIAIGGDLSEERLLLAYLHGIFPWYSFRYREKIMWYCPLDRFVIFPPEIHVSHSMRSLMNKNKYKITIDQDFDGVIKSCSEVDGRINESGAWLGPDIIKAYTRLHEDGYAKSVEVWEGEKLVGGLYGVSLGSNFFGESMFSFVPNGSKLALIHLARTLSNSSSSMIDCQFETSHLKSMGGRHIPYENYIEILSKNINPLKSL